MHIQITTEAVGRYRPDEQIAVVDAGHLRELLTEVFDLDVDEVEAERLFAAAAERARSA